MWSSLKVQFCRQMTCVYGPPSLIQSRQFWDTLDSLGNAHTRAWMLIGDFNSLVSSADKLGGKTVASSSNGGLRRLMDDFALIDLGFVGHAFTWNNKRRGLANIQEKLDRGMANEEWKFKFPKATITHLVALISDHKPLLLQTNPPVTPMAKPFRLESMWI